MILSPIRSASMSSVNVREDEPGGRILFKTSEQQISKPPSQGAQDNGRDHVQCILDTAPTSSHLVAVAEVQMPTDAHRRAFHRSEMAFIMRCSKTSNKWCRTRRQFTIWRNDQSGDVAWEIDACLPIDANVTVTLVAKTKIVHRPVSLLNNGGHRQCTSLGLGGSPLYVPYSTANGGTPEHVYF